MDRGNNRASSGWGHRLQQYSMSFLPNGKAASSLCVQSISGSYTNASSRVSSVSLPLRRILRISSHEMRNRPWDRGKD